MPASCFLFLENSQVVLKRSRTLSRFSYNQAFTSAQRPEDVLLLSPTVPVYSGHHGDLGSLGLTKSSGTWGSPELYMIMFRRPCTSEHWTWICMLGKCPNYCAISCPFFFLLTMLFIGGLRDKFHGKLLFLRPLYVRLAFEGIWKGNGCVGIMALQRFLLYPFHL